jgi:hypothetical protein
MTNLSTQYERYVDPQSLEEAERRQAEARFAVASIEHQLREKENDFTPACRDWRKKAKWALWCKKESLTRLSAWVRRNNRLVDLTLNGKEKLPDIDPRDPNRLLLHTFNLARTLAGRQHAMKIFLSQEECEVLNAVRSYYLEYPELIPDSKSA